MYAVAARFDNKHDLIEAAKLAKEQGYQCLEVYSPFPIEEVNEILGYREDFLPWVVFGGGILGALTGFGMQYAANVLFLQLDIGGRPYNSWPAFIPITFELTILFAAIAGFVGVIMKCKLPQIYHPMFNLSEFERASLDSFFLCVTAQDRRFNASDLVKFFQMTNAKEIKDVEG